MATSQNEMRIVLLGKSGNGKSALGNSLLHSRSNFFPAQSAESITRDCSVGRYEHRDNNGLMIHLTVVDTPGFFDTDPKITNAMTERKIASQIFEMATAGVHAFLIVIGIGRFTPEEKNTIDFIRNVFGSDAVKYCIVVFTREDQLDEGSTLDEFINTSSALQELVHACESRKFSINNKLNGQPLEKKTNQLIEIIDNMIRNNSGSYYTNSKYQLIKRKRQEEEEKKEEDESRKKKAEEDAIIDRTRDEERKKHEEEIQKARQDQREAEQREKDLRSDWNFARNISDTIAVLSFVGQLMQFFGFGGGSGHYTLFRRGH